MFIPKTDKPFFVGLIGTAATGTNNVLTVVNTTADLAQFGADTGGTIVAAARVLLRYGVPLIVNKIDGSGTATVTETNIVGTTNPNTGLELFRDAQATLGIAPRALIVPGFSTVNIATKVNDVATALGIPGIVDFIGTYANLLTARGTATGFGIKSRFFFPCFPQLQRGTVLEYLSCHVAGLIGRASKIENYGVFPHLRRLDSITGITPAMTLTGAAPNNVTLHDLGVLSVANLNGNWQLFGFRNGSFTNTNQGLTALAVGIILEWEARSLLLPVTQSLTAHLPASTASIQQIQQHLDSILKEEAGDGNLGAKSFVRYNSDLSTATSYVFDACLAPRGSFQSGTLTLTLI